MASLIRTTVFGQAMRLVSNNKMFRYPDELDPLLWNNWIEQNEPANAQSAKEQINGTSPKYPHKSGVDHRNDNPAREENVLLVGWYGVNDLEASSATCSVLCYC